ncbi:MAG: restriction endonuclease [Eubacteriales bacterium]|nr:restriction endonuclease [Eubacteriales bacterium]
MTIVEALKIVMEDKPTGMTSKEAYEQIIQQGLYTFPAKNPAAVVNSTIRKQCVGIDFPSCLRTKAFYIVDYKGKKPMYALLKDIPSGEIVEQSIKTVAADSEKLPEEKIQESYREHITSVSAMLLNQVMENDPSFFEHLVVELLLKMGYGYDEKSGIVIGKSHDGGIDGIINEDKLGLDLIYLQAKRYKFDNSVGRKELQAFVGAMQNVHKGVFITTSYFTKEAQSYADSQQQKALRLLDGSALASLMIKYEVGVAAAAEYKVYRIDQSFFE